MKLYSAGRSVDFKGLHYDINPSARHTDLPLYPFQFEPHSYPVRKAAKVSSTTTIPNAVQLFPRVPSTELAPLLQNHVMAGYTLCPATTHLALLLSVASTFTSIEGRSAYKLFKFKVLAGFTNTTDGWLQVRRQLPSSDLEIISNEDKVHITARGEVCKEQDLLESFSLFQSFILPLKSFKSLPSTDILRKELAYSLFSHTVSYGSHGQVLDRVWIAEDRHQAWGYSTYPLGGRTAQGTLSSLQDFSPMLIESACQLVGFLINTSSDRGSGEAFVTDEIGECAIAVSRLHGTEHVEMYASYKIVDGGSAALGQVFAFDDKGQLISAFRDVCMAKMKMARVEEHNVANDGFDEKVIAVFRTALRLSDVPRDKSVSLGAFFIKKSSVSNILNV